MGGGGGGGPTGAGGELLVAMDAVENHPSGSDIAR